MAIHKLNPSVSELRKSVKGFPLDARIFTTATVQYLLDVIAEQEEQLRLAKAMYEGKATALDTIVSQRSSLYVGCGNG